MKLLIIFFTVLHISLSATIKENVNYEVQLDNGRITYESKDQNYAYKVETSDGTVKHEKGLFEEDNIIVEGGYEYIGDNGLKYNVVYVADKDGYRSKVFFGSKIVQTVPVPYSVTFRTPIRDRDSYVDPSVLGGLIGGGIFKRSYKIE